MLTLHDCPNCATQIFRDVMDGEEFVFHTGSGVYPSICSLYPYYVPSSIEPWQDVDQHTLVHETRVVNQSKKLS